MTSWWLCPNGECEHGNVLHDVEDMEDDRPRCCVDGCTCGKKQPDAFWTVGNEVGIRSKVVEVEWDNIGRTYTYRLSGVEGWYDEGELTT